MKKKFFSLLLAAVLSFSALSGCGKSESGEKLYLYNWTEYIPQ